MKLQPKRPPGRADRKAAEYASEIVRLRADGYTYDAIREAIAEFGIELSESTLRREVRRQQKHVVRAAPDQRPLPSPPSTKSTPQPTHAQASELHAPIRTTGREIAEAFFTTHPSNPLFPTKETS